MSSNLKKFIALAATACLIGVAYYGTWLPLQKSQAYVAGLQGRRAIKSWDDFTSAFTPALAKVSPIGQEELVKNFGSLVQSLLGLNSQSRPEVAEAVLKYYGQFMDPLVARGHGLSYGQTIYVAAAVQQTAFEATGGERFAKAAEQLYRRGLEYSPHRPQYLYGLLKIYVKSNRREEAKRIAEEILSFWPTDNDVRKALEELQ
ncbi:MAG: tetratricopeptide repeat protein [Candidatus Liptonbacteria bacterium]|nr:tetratricopeptide repeat protein [Candidatus Liptonbacteria bacterium]